MNQMDTISVFNKKKSHISFFKNLFQKELSLLLIVGVIGCIGTFFIFTKAWNYNTEPTHQLLNTITISKCDKNTVAGGLYHPMVYITGNYMENNPVAFKISDYNMKALYKVDFGDGTESIFQDDTFEHTYKSSGDFKIKMAMHYKEIILPIYETTLSIKNSDQALITSP